MSCIVPYVTDTGHQASACSVAGFPGARHSEACWGSMELNHISKGKDYSPHSVRQAVCSEATRLQK